MSEDHANGSSTVQQPRLALTKKAADQDLQLRRRKEANKAYGRGKAIQVRDVRDRKLRGNLKKLEEKNKTAALRAKDAEILLENDNGFLEPENELERTYRMRQDEISENVGLETSKKRFDVKLDLGPYTMDFTRNGRGLLLAGRKGHVATIDLSNHNLGCELQLGETVRDAKWLFNNQRFAVAQKKYVYIYDSAGVELHVLKKHIDVTSMTFLPYHYLLATVGNAGYLKYQDISTGQMVIEMPMKSGPNAALAQNPHNAILHIGNSNGVVNLWSPNSTTPLVSMRAHIGPVLSIDCDREGRYMVTTGMDSKMAVWDIRMYKEVNNYLIRGKPATSVSISDTGLTAVGHGTQTDVWRGLFNKNLADQEKVQSPYMNWGRDGKMVERVRWRPFEDVLGISHDQGYSSILVPGAGEANYDALEVNPYENTKQRQETEVRSLLNKLQPEMISLNANYIGNLDLVSAEERKKEQDLDRKPEDIIADIKNRSRGKNSSLRNYLRKKGGRNIIDEKRMRILELRDQQKQKQIKETKEELGPALGRFARK